MHTEKRGIIFMAEGQKSFEKVAQNQKMEKTSAENKKRGELEARK